MSALNVERLTDDIGAMLHYRGRVARPRTHPRTVGGPCDECIESARQAIEFVVAHLDADSPLGHGTPVPEEAELPSGDARIEAL